jgi:hypothetical protein
MNQMSDDPRAAARMTAARMMVAYWSDSRDEPTEADIALIVRIEAALTSAKAHS